MSKLIDKIIVNIWILIMIGLLMYVAIDENKIKEIEWNNGICTECEGKMEFIQAVGHKCWTTYLYKCNQCGRLYESEVIR